MNIYLEYVLENFYLIYEQNIDFLISYDGSNPDAKIIIPDLTNLFFEKEENLDFSKIVFKNYLDQNVPILFAAKDSQIFENIDGKIYFNDDIIASVFYFLSNWQELNAPKDNLGRFEYAVSIQHQLQIINIPVVNYYFKMLADAFEIAYRVKLINKIHPTAPFVTCVTHDVDVWSQYWKSELKYALKVLNVNQIFQICSSLLKNTFLSTSFKLIENIQIKYKFQSTFFFLTRKENYFNYTNGDYNIVHNRYQKIIANSLKNGNTIGLHGGFSTSFDTIEFGKDLNKLPQKLESNRFHYLMYNAKITPQILEFHQIKYDSTLGFNSVPGFRNGTSYPFYLYNHTTTKTTAVIAIPLIIMDVSIFSSNYLSCQNANEGFDKIKIILHQIVKTGGVLTLNWHNNYFSKINYLEWSKLFEMIIAFAHQNSSRFEKIDNVIRK